MTNVKTDTKVPDFYDDFVEQQVTGYVEGNPRVDAAVQHAARWIPSGAGRILDIGCGIGNGTWEIKRNHPKAQVLGVDISPKSVETARRIFPAPKLEFATWDVSQWSPLFEPAFDAIVLMDVYEHIPLDQRHLVHQVLGRALSGNGVLILTVPSTLHQSFLRTRQPEGLQVIDEDVTFDAIAQLANDIDGQILLFNHVNVWRSSDYIHIVIQRNPPFIWNNQREVKKLLPAEAKTVRAKRADGQAAPPRLSSLAPAKSPGAKEKVVCVIHPNRDAYSETFIAAHIQRLPARVKSLHGAWFPTHNQEGGALLPGALRLAALAAHRLPQRPRAIVHNLRNKNLERFLATNKVDIVLAEYGPTGVSVMDSCQNANVPFVVHFHGFDAYEHATLDEYGGGYRRMFQAAAGIVAVSREMEQQLLQLGAPREKLFYNSCGGDTDLFSGADPASAPPLFVAVGRFTDKKGPQLTLLAFASVLKACPNAQLVMIGDGALWESCKQMAEAMQLGDSVQFPGPLPHGKIAETMRSARAFVQHSVTVSDGDKEGTPVAVLEAGAAGLPVISTRHAGIKDVVIHEKTGFLVDERDVEGMAKYMALLAENATLAATLGKAAREHIRENYSIDKSIERLWEILSGALKSA